MEVLVGARTAELSQVREDFLRQFRMIELDAVVARRAIALRQEHRLRLPDAIVWASARALLVTRNVKHFPGNHPGVRAPSCRWLQRLGPQQINQAPPRRHRRARRLQAGAVTLPRRLRRLLPERSANQERSRKEMGR